jgi:hypothetical protein
MKSPITPLVKLVNPFGDSLPDGQNVSTFSEKIVPKHKEGDIWRLLKTNSPMWTSQWGYQGSATAPYIVSKKPDDMSNGSTTSDGWACSCMNFTRHTPRTPCKHILNVMVKEGVAGVNKPRVKLANVDVEKMKAFEVWQREQAARKKDVDPTAGARVKLILFGTTSRKFR